MFYSPDLIKPTQYSDFDYESLCVWIVYPPGCSGDLWGAIIGQHYPRTGNHFLGIDSTGRVILSTVDGKILNFKLIDREPVEFGQHLLDEVNRGYRIQNFSRAMSGQTILINHCWEDQHVSAILDRFPNARGIRILPEDDFEVKITQWMSQWKNHNNLIDFDSINTFDFLNQIQNSNYSNDRLLDIKFGSVWSESGFEKTYDQVVQHLGLPYKLIRYDFIKFWFECQHDMIKPQLLKLFQRA